MTKTNSLLIGVGFALTLFVGMAIGSCGSEETPAVVQSVPMQYQPSRGDTWADQQRERELERRIEMAEDRAECFAVAAQTGRSTVFC